MRFITLSVLTLSLWSGAAIADRDHRDHRDHHEHHAPVVRDHRAYQPPVVRDNRTYQRPVVRDNRTYQRPVVRDNRHYAQPIVRDHRISRPRYVGPIHENRRVIDRRPIYVNNGRFTFHNGHTYVYARPIIRERYYDVHIRPQIIVETHPAQYGYIWVNGSWGWSGYEWTWNGGHYEADPSYSVYYDDDSYETYEY